VSAEQRRWIKDHAFQFARRLINIERGCNLGAGVVDLKASTALLAIMLATPAYSEPVLGLGIPFSWGGGAPGQVGISARLLSDNRAERLIASGGVTYFFGGGIGADLGVGYNFQGGISTGLGYDFLNNRPLFSLSAANIC
jgi:hypothetical protein